MNLLLAQTLKEYRHSLNLAPIGEGLRSVVYEHASDPTLVVKVFHNDAPYLDWLNFCRRHRGNPCLPVVYSVTLLNVVEPEAYVVEIEKLRPISQYTIKDFFLRLAAAHGLTLNTRLLFIEWFTAQGWRRIAQTADRLAPIALWFATHYDQLDLNPENIMARGRQIVFSDPVI